MKVFTSKAIQYANKLAKTEMQFYRSVSENTYLEAIKDVKLLPVQKMNTIYVASKIIHAPMWREYRDKRNMPISSSWINNPTDNVEQDFKKMWVKYINEIKSSNFLIAYRESNEILKGAYIEIGVALSSDIEVFLVGIEPGVSFAFHPLCHTCETLDIAFNLAK